MAGIFVAVEGIDAAGKGTQSRLLAERLRAQLVTFPRYETPIGKLIDGYLKERWYVVENAVVSADPKPEHYVRCKGEGAYVFQSLMILNRYEVAPEILECRSKGTSVVCDRYNDSSVIYGLIDGIPKEYTHKLGEHLPKPDLHILIDISVEEMRKRRPNGRDRHETNLEFMGKVAQAYRDEWAAQQQKNPAAWVVIDGIGSVEEVHQRIISAIAKVRV